MTAEAMLPRAEPRGALGVGLFGAVIVHVGIVLAAVAQPARAAAAPPPVEVEIEAPEPPKETPKEEPPKEEPKPEPAPVAKAEPTPAAATPPPAAPPAAKAGALLTANDDAPKAKGEEPVSFVTDPNGDTYGSGVVAKGGTAEVGLPGAALPTTTAVATKTVTAPPPPPKVEPTPTTNLSKKPSLDQPDACKGYFPQAADDDHAVVTLRVIVRPDGSVQAANVVSETPQGQGFGPAARSCLLGRTFSPGLSEAGQPTLAQTTVNVRFSR